MQRRVHRGRRLLVASTLAAAVVGGWSAAAHAQSGGAGGSGSPAAGSGVVGETVTANAIGAQFAFNIPGLIPLPNQNLIEVDVPFARSLVSTGPTVQSIGAPYYPGDILANLGGLESEFLPPAFPNIPYPFMAEAEYPATPQYGSSATFGGPAPGGSSPLAALSGTAHATSSGGDANGTITDLVVGAGMGRGGAPLLEAASERSDEAVDIGASSVTATASAVLKSIDIAGMLDISEISSNASSTSDGTTGTPTATLTIGQVTVDGQPAYIDGQGVHVLGTNPAPAGTPTVAQLQSALNQTLAQDGISVRLLDPEQTSNGAEGIANSGGLVVSISHNFSVPFLDTGGLTGALLGPNNAVQPCIPTQDITEALGQGGGLGEVCLPAGNYTAVTSITLGFATTDVNASVLQSLGLPGVNLGSGGLGSGLGTGLGTGGLGVLPGATGAGLTALGSQTTLGTVSGPGAPPASSRPGTGLFGLTVRGIPTSVGWVVGGLLLCILAAYPMMLVARWQFLVGRR